MRAGPHWMISLPLVAVLALTSCSRAPNDKIRMVSSAFQGLEAMKAKDYAPKSYRQAEVAYDEAMAEVALQRQTSVYKRSFSQANELLAKAKEAVELAVHHTEERRDAVALEAGDSIEEAKDALHSTESELATLEAPAPKKGNIRMGLDNAAETLKEAQDAFDSGDFLSARSKAEDANVAIVKAQVVIEDVRGR